MTKREDVKNWGIINSDFNHVSGEYLKGQWEINGFSFEDAKSWGSADLRPWEANTAWWIVNVKKKNPESRSRTKFLKEEFEGEKSKWKNIDKDFIYDTFIDWQKRGFDYSEAEKFVQVYGFKPSEFCLAKHLKDNEILNSKNIEKDLDNFREEYYSNQNWLNINYPLAERSRIKKISIDDKNLTGSMVIKGFDNLEEFYCLDGKLESFDFIDCPKLEVILCQRNQLRSLNLKNCPKIRKLVCNKNRVESLDFLKDLNKKSLEFFNISSNNIKDSDLSPFEEFINLKHLGLGNWYEEFVEQGIKNNIHGSLMHLKDLKKLVELDLTGIDIESGLEHLSDSIKTLYLSSKEVEGKVIKLEEELIKYQEPSHDKHDDLNFADCLRTWKYHFKEQEKLTAKMKLSSLDSVTEVKPIIAKKIGAGGFAVVYRGTWNGQPVAIKKSNYSPKIISSSEMKLIKEEIELLKKLKNCPYIVQFYGLYHDDNDLMIIMELAEYGSLERFIRRNKSKDQNWERNSKFIVQMAKGLKFLHTNKVIHRDLKSMNILIAEGHIAKISDFGLSKVTSELNSVQSVSKGMVGTPKYWAPEIFTQNKPHSFLTDIYSLGMIIWEIATREVPFKNLDSMRIMAVFFQGRREEIPADCPADVREVIEGCWREVPEDRITLNEIIDKFDKEVENFEDDFSDASFIELSDID